MKSYNVFISFNIEQIADNAQDAVRYAVNKVKCPGTLVANFEARIINERTIDKEVVSDDSDIKDAMIRKDTAFYQLDEEEERLLEEYENRDQSDEGPNKEEMEDEYEPRGM